MAVEKTLLGASAGRTVLVTGGAGYIGSAGRRGSRAGLGSAGRGLRRGWRAGLGWGAKILAFMGGRGREAGAVYTPLLIVSREEILNIRKKGKKPRSHQQLKQRTSDRPFSRLGIEVDGRRWGCCTRSHCTYTYTYTHTHAQAVRLAFRLNWRWGDASCSWPRAPGVSLSPRRAATVQRIDGQRLTRRWAPPRGSDCGEKRSSGRDALRWGCDLASWLDRSHEKANAFFRCAAVFSPSSRISDKMLDGLTWSVGCFFPSSGEASNSVFLMTFSLPVIYWYIITRRARKVYMQLYAGIQEGTEG
jgi:hypothetical protein